MRADGLDASETAEHPVQDPAGKRLPAGWERGVRTHRSPALKRSPTLLRLAGELPRCRKSGHLLVPRGDGQQGLLGDGIVELVREGECFFCPLMPIGRIVDWGGMRHLRSNPDALCRVPA